MKTIKLPYKTTNDLTIILKQYSSVVRFSYNRFLEGNKEKEDVLNRLDERLKRLAAETQLEKAAEKSENLNKTLGYRPLGFYIA